MKPKCILLSVDANLANANNQRTDLGTYVPVQDQGVLYHKTQSASIQDAYRNFKLPFHEVSFNLAF